MNGLEEIRRLVRVEIETLNNGAKIDRYKVLVEKIERFTGNRFVSGRTLQRFVDGGKRGPSWAVLKTLRSYFKSRLDVNRALDDSLAR